MNANLTRDFDFIGVMMWNFWGTFKKMPSRVCMSSETKEHLGLGDAIFGKPVIVNDGMRYRDVAWNNDDADIVFSLDDKYLTVELKEN